MKKSILSVLAIAALALSLTSCKKNEEVTGTGFIQFTNASELASPLDLYIADSKKNTAPIAYNQSTAYFSVAAKEQPANIKVAVTGASVFNFNVTPVNGVYYSIFYIAEGTAVAYEDNLKLPATGKARVRFINLNMSASGSNDFGIAGEPKLVSNLTSKENSAYYDVTPGATFSAYNAGETTVLISIPTTIEAGHIYTIYLSGKDLAGLKANVLLQK